MHITTSDLASYISLASMCALVIILLVRRPKRY
jgi:hypothetical protein